MHRLEPILDRIGTDRSIVICPMIDAINDKTMEFSSQGGLAVGGFTWSLHFTWRAVPDREQKHRKSDASPARYIFLLFVFFGLFIFLLTKGMKWLPFYQYVVWWLEQWFSARVLQNLRVPLAPARDSAGGQ